MSKILFIEHDPVAVKAMDGIIRRSPHELTRVENVFNAEKLLNDGFDYDVLIMEVKDGGSNSLKFIRELKANRFAKALPIIVYSEVNDKTVIKSILALGVQNYLFKPYKENILLDEISRHCAVSWQIELGGASKKFYKSLETHGKHLHESNSELLLLMKTFHEKIKENTSPEHMLAERKEIDFLAAKARNACFASFAEYLEELLDYGISRDAMKLDSALSFYSSACLLQKSRLSYIEKALNLRQESGKTQEAVQVPDDDIEITRYLNLEDVEKRILEISNYPVMESAAAAFQMSTHDEDTNLDEIVEMIQRDSGLATSVLRFSNMSAISHGGVIEDIHQAIAVLGLKRIRLLALSLNTVPELSSMFTALKWENFWMHQVGCAMLAEEVTRRLGLNVNSELAYIAGLIHDIGKILLNEVDSELYKQVLAHALKYNLPLQQKEKEHFGCSHDYAGLIYAKNSKLPESLQACIKYQFEPEKATSHQEIVSVLFLANYFCVTYQIGDNGDRFVLEGELQSHAVWQVLEPFLSSGFSVKRFIREIELRIKSLKIELSGMAREQAKIRTE